MKKITIIVLITLAATALLSCRTSKSVIIEKYTKDTIISLDTTLIIKADTLKSVYPCVDTVIIKEKERVKMITQVKDGVVFTVCEAKPDEISIKKDKLINVVKSFYHHEKKQQTLPFWQQILILVLAIAISIAIIFLIVLDKIFKL